MKGMRARLDGRLGVLARGVPLLLGQLQQLLEPLLQVPVRLRQPRQLLELAHLGHPARARIPYIPTLVTLRAPGYPISQPWSPCRAPGYPISQPWSPCARQDTLYPNLGHPVARTGGRARRGGVHARAALSGAVAARPARAGGRARPAWSARQPLREEGAWRRARGGCWRPVGNMSLASSVDPQA